MIRGMAWLAVLSLLVGPIWANDDALTLKLKDKAQGETVQVEKKSTERSSIKVTDGQGNNLKENEENKTQNLVYQQTILQKQPGEKQARKLQRHYQKAEIKTGDHTRKLPYDGKTVLIEKKGNRYQFQLEGSEELTGKDAEELDREFNKQGEDTVDFNKLMLPRKPVRVGESWTVDTQAIIQDLEKSAPMEFDAAGAKGSAKLIKAYQQDGRQFGVVEYRLELPLKAFKIEEQKAPIDEGAVMVLTARVDGCIDGSLNSNTAKLRMLMKGRAQLSQGGAKFTLNFDTRADGVETERELARK